MKKIISFALKSRTGFTLLEVMIAIAIVAMGMAGIIVAQNNSLDVTFRAKRMTTVANLAKNLMIQTEREIEGKVFSEIKNESSGTFDAPFSEYQWERKIKEITFPDLMDPSMGGAPASGGNAADSAVGSAGDAQNENVTRVVKIATEYLSKATREITITVKWKDRGQDQKFSVSQYWVDLNHVFTIN